MVGVPALITETFSCSYPKHHRARTHKPEVNKHSKASKDPIMCTDGFAPCDGLVGWGCKHHHRVSSGENESVERGNPGSHINGIESFWGYVKNRLVRCQGMPKEDFYLHLKGCEFRFNMWGRDMYRFMLRKLRERPLN